MVNNSNWVKLVNENDLTSLIYPNITKSNINNLLTLATKGTRNGDFKITPSGGLFPAKNNRLSNVTVEQSPGKGTYKLSDHDGIFWLKYYSICIIQDIKKFGNIPPITANVWFYINLYLEGYGEYPENWVFVGYLKDSNDPTSIEWWRYVDDWKLITEVYEQPFTNGGNITWYKA